jgi:hypothetical protein
MAKKKKEKKEEERRAKLHLLHGCTYVSFLLVFFTIIKKIVKILVNVLTIPSQSQ